MIWGKMKNWGGDPIFLVMDEGRGGGVGVGKNLIFIKRANFIEFHWDQEKNIRESWISFNIESKFEPRNLYILIYKSPLLS